jgi:hypothetical protein
MRMLQTQVKQICSPIAWKYARQFRHAFVPQRGLDAPAATLTGWRLARRGYDRPPAWLLQERLEL